MRRQNLPFPPPGQGSSRLGRRRGTIHAQGGSKKNEIALTKGGRNAARRWELPFRGRILRKEGFPEPGPAPWASACLPEASLTFSIGEPSGQDKAGSTLKR